MATEGRKKLTLSLPSDVVTRIDRRAAARGVTRTEWVTRAALRALIDAEGPLTYETTTITTTERTTTVKT